MGEHAFGGHPALDEMRGRRRLSDAFLALAAGVLRAHRDDDLKRCRNDVQPLGAVLADLRHLAATAGAQDALGLDHLVGARQVGGQMTDVVFRDGTLRTRRRRRARRGVGLGLGERAFELLEGEQELVGVELLGLLSEHRPAQLAHQVFEATVAVFEIAVALGERDDPGVQVFDDRFGALLFEAAVALGERRVLGAQRLNSRLLAFDQRPQGRRKRCEIDRAGARFHDRILSWNQQLSKEQRSEKGEPDSPHGITPPRAAGAPVAPTPGANRAPRTTPRTAPATDGSPRREPPAKRTGPAPDASMRAPIRSRPTIEP